MRRPVAVPTCSVCGVECPTCRENARARDAYRVGYEAGRAEVRDPRATDALDERTWRSLAQAIHPDKLSSPEGALRAMQLVNRLRPAKRKAP